MVIDNKGNAKIVYAVIDAIHENARYLSEIDGVTGDGDHGINMDKGFQLAKTRIKESMSFTDALNILGRTLVMDIGGSMGPIYGTFFSSLSRSLKEKDKIQAGDLYNALDMASENLQELAGAKPGDKTLIDTIVPALDDMKVAIDLNKSQEEIIEAMRSGALAGKEGTKGLQAKIGRAARLGERSVGFLDAGATSCWIILDQIGLSFLE